MLPPVLLVGLVACGHPDRLSPALARTSPRLPAPEAAVYTRVDGTSRDPAVASVLGELPWDEALSGAAGALAMVALEGREPDLWAARWAAYRAGFLHPLVLVAFQSCPLGCAGRDVITRLQQAFVPGDAVGVARARGPVGDAWVGILARPAVPLGPIPRRVDVGARLDLALLREPMPGLRVRAVSPGGHLSEGDFVGSASLLLDEMGEWWVEVGESDRWTRFPVYAGMAPAAGPPLDEVPDADPTDPEDGAWALLQGVRDTWGLLPVFELPLAASVARARRDALLGLRDPPAPGEDDPPCGASFACRIGPAGVRGCFQDWLMSAPTRAPLLGAACRGVGVAAGEVGGVTWLVVEIQPG